MDKFVISTGAVHYTGPLTLVAWMMIHPWMTFFIAMAFCSALEELFKAIGKCCKRK